MRPGILIDLRFPSLSLWSLLAIHIRDLGRTNKWRDVTGEFIPRSCPEESANCISWRTCKCFGFTFALCRTSCQWLPYRTRLVAMEDILKLMVLDEMKATERLTFGSPR